MEIKIRDLTKSRDKWKSKTHESSRSSVRRQQELNELQQIQKKGTTIQSNTSIMTQEQSQNKDVQIALSNPVGHVYSVFIIQLAIQQIIYGLSSLRGCEKNFTLFAQFFAVQTPTFSTIRNWLFRFGLYQLTVRSFFSSKTQIIAN